MAATKELYKPCCTLYTKSISQLLQMDEANEDRESDEDLVVTTIQGSLELTTIKGVKAFTLLYD